MTRKCNKYYDKAVKCPTMIVVDEQASRYQMNHAHNHPTSSETIINTTSRPLTAEMRLATSLKKTPKVSRKKKIKQTLEENYDGDIQFLIKNV